MSGTVRKAAAEIAAVDLGSNSFHMIVARPQGASLNVVDRLRETVRLAAALDERQRLQGPAAERALACLKRFGERLRALPPGAVRAVGTNTLRVARNGAVFLRRAEAALGHRIDIISGTEEARLIYLGVSRSLPDSAGRRLVLDIGGGSTELIVGEGPQPLHMQSLYMGCVSFTQAQFAGRGYKPAAFERARVSARLELEPHEALFRHYGWREAVGASGTVKAAARTLAANGWAREGISREGLQRLWQRLRACRNAADVAAIPGVGAERAPVMAAGTAILLAVFEALELTRMRVSEGALREGALFDLWGRHRHEDARETAVAGLARRYHADAAQAQRVAGTALALLRQAERAWSLEGEDWADLLRWAALLHEVGLDIAHSQYHKHGAYVLEHADLTGFSRREQQALAAMVRAHRRKFPVEAFSDLPVADTLPVQRLAVLLRLAVVLHRGRDAAGTARLAVAGRTLRLRLPAGWKKRQPLTAADLEQEAEWLRGGGFRLELAR
jgi:exopolyphosphatase/guanosine-5'-triphosphate,3'-diphosphate pyrophosphatase